MKKLWAAWTVLLPVAYIIGRWKTPRQTIVVKPPDVHVHPPALGTEAPLGRYAKWRGGFDRNKVWLDPYIVALISAVAAGFAIVIAWNSNEINEKQSELLAQQIAIEDSRALPIFDFERQLENRGDELWSWIVMSNEGGLTRSVVLDIFYSVSVSWSMANGERASYFLGVDDLPREYDSNEIELSREGSEMIANHFPLDEIERATGRLIQGMKQGLGTERFQIFHYFYASVEYQDYQGNNRKEYYYLMTALDPTSTTLNVVVMSEDSFMRLENARNRDPKLPIGITDEQAFRAQIVAIVNAMKLEEEARRQTLVASPVALSDVRHRSSWRER